MAADNSGLYVSELTRTVSLPVTVAVEIHFFKEHTLIEVESHYEQTDLLKAIYRVSVVYNESWQDQMNFIGYKNVGKTFSFIEAYIAWE
jgi:hypothetical protein